MHVVCGILPGNFVPGVCLSLVARRLLGNVPLNLLSGLSICADPPPRVGRFYPANLMGSRPPALTSLTPA